ncbi:MAG TPA: ABC transporter ATP-binding protein [Aliidongia sp.]|uniref:ABC transporter ATP-binding protein n=1 Tax=Aliidongia sp. TaxID=1914230 RepID=UPI002DDD2C7F|nr:ABC transporter ATP-binding protein [Aliidongia sp.]HEV2678840.1 ABC transporter ATP-binding protein [Aliidongia sp.]
MSGGLAPAIAFDRITKRFGAVVANDGVSCEISPGSIHGIIGENGAGKSTLMSILYGFYQADAGEIRLDGQAVRIHSSADAIRLGIGMVHQHFVLVEPFTVLENLALGHEGGLMLQPGLDRARAEARRIEAAYGLAVDLDAKVEDLAVGARQRVEILKALYRGARILILDEPTGVLTPDEAQQLFQILRRLKSEGKTVLLITHKLKEIMAATDRVTVMRAGRVVGDVATSGTTEADLAERMVGRKLAPLPDRVPVAPAAPILRAEGLSVIDAGGVERVRGIDLDLRPGEIVGIAGVSGNGQSELMAALAGLTPLAAGRLVWAGVPVPAEDTAMALRRLGLGHIPEDRHKNGMIGAFEAWETSVLGYHRDVGHGQGAWLRPGFIRALTRQRMVDYDVRPRDERLRTAAFSGGNQQKLICAREMARGPKVLLVGQPTRGVDVGAIEQIHARLRALKAAGTAILLVSVELDEILALADRILVMVDGRFTGELDRSEATERALGLLMAGVRDEAA